nr:uncharacterized protein LOC109181645 [Ipomoea batatas]
MVLTDAVPHFAADASPPPAALTKRDLSVGVESGNENRAAESQLSLKAFHTSTCPCMKKNSVLHKENCHLSATVISPEHNGDVFPGTFDHVDWKCTLLIFSHLLYGV